MATAAEHYLSELVDKLGSLVSTQASAVETAAQLCADALAARRPVHVYDTGHMLSQELVARTGGLVAFAALKYDASVTSHNEWRARHHNAAHEPIDDARALLEWVFLQGTVVAGDVLIVSSVSGNSAAVVELALQARHRGVHVIAVTGVRYSRELSSKHPCGQRLFEVADVVLDNLADYGDAFFKLPGLDALICPISGVAGTALMWAVIAATVENVVARGLEPSIFPSINLPDGPQLVERVESRYRDEGY
jgi:uncharacterized phosphosugar-binding protein